MKRALPHFAEHILALPRSGKRAIILVVDTGLCLLSTWLAFYLRLGEFQSWTGQFLSPWLLAATVSVLMAIPIFVKSGLYRAIIRYSGLPAMMAISRAMLLYGVMFAAVFTFFGVRGVPRTVGLIQPLLLFVLVGASRAAALEAQRGGLADHRRWTM
jgi:FlaA1/EpsC-like NDP-sugar epimerase